MERISEDFWVEIADWPYHLSRKGYAVIFVPECPLAHKNGQMYRCRYVAWAFGKLHDPTDTVHHRDRDKLNDHPDNLEVMSREAHGRLHGQAMPAEVRAKIAEKRKGWVWSDEMKAHFSEVHKGQRLSEEAKRKLSEANTGRTITWGDRISVTLKARGIKPPTYSRAGRSLPEETKAKLSVSVRESWNGRREEYEARKNEWIGLEYVGAKRAEIARAYEVSPATITRVLGAS